MDLTLVDEAANDDVGDLVDFAAAMAEASAGAPPSHGGPIAPASRPRRVRARGAELT